MPSHPDLTAAFRSGLRDGALPPGLTVGDPEEADRRFAVYRNNVAHGLTEALGQRFPVVKRLVGEAFFRATARVFIDAHPPASPVLLAWGTAFPEFLEGFPPVRSLPYLPDMAQLETARGQAYHAADCASLSPEEVSRLAQDPEAARPGLHPSVRVVASRFALVSIWRANQPGAADRTVAAATPETGLVLRDRSLDVRVHLLGAGDAAFVSGLRERCSLLSAAAAALRAEPGHDPGLLLSFLTRAGALVAPEAPPERESPR